MIVAFDKYINGTDDRYIDSDAKTVVLGDAAFSGPNTFSLYDYFIYGREQEGLDWHGLVISSSYLSFRNFP